MRCAVLIIGSLLWDDETAGRTDWRQSRLSVADQLLVKLSFCYGRKSQLRGNTFTMTFGTGESSSQGVLVPCTKEIETIDSLVEEANGFCQTNARYVENVILGCP